MQERNRINKSSIVTNNQFSTIIEKASDAIISIDESQNIILFNSAAEKIFGYQKDAVLGQPLNTLLPKQYWASHQQKVSEFSASPEQARPMSGRRGVEGQRKSGETFPAEASISKSIIDGKKIFTVLLRDVTEAKQTEADLNKIQKMHNEAQRIAHLGHWALDLVKNELIWSDENCRIFGVEPGTENTYETFLKTVHPDDRELVNNAYTDSVKNRVPYNIEHRLLMQDGSVKYVNERCETYYAEDGTPLRSLGTTLDITKRKRAEVKLKENEARLSGILDAAAEAVISVDESQHITLFNNSAEEIFGYEENEILGQPLGLLLPEKYRTAHQRSIANFGASSEQARNMSARGEIKGRRKNGKIFPAEASISKVELNGKKTFTAVLRDTSDRKKAEKILHNSFVESIATLMRAAEFRDDETGAHVKRISYYTKTLAETLGMDDSFCENIFYASAMHDIGKIGIPDHILLKPSSLTLEESNIMKTHTVIGGDILAGNSSPYLQLGEQIAQSHHERWDGSGYPNGLAGDAIPLAARIMQLADVYDALRSERPYKKAFDHVKTLEIITNGDGRTEPSHFDPAVLAAFQQCASKMNEIFEELKTVKTSYSEPTALLE